MHDDAHFNGKLNNECSTLLALLLGKMAKMHIFHSERKKSILLYFAGTLFVQKLNHRNISSVQV